MQFQQKVVAKEPKLTFPEFDGTDPDGWIRKSKKFFELAAVPTEVNSVMYLSGKAEYWWRGTGCNPSTLPWHQFCRLLEDRFLEISTTEIIGQFHNLNQTATVPKYIDKFEEFMGLVKRNNPSLQEDYFVSRFITGLTEYIQHHLQCHKPSSLTKAFWFARILEQANPPPRKYTMYPQLNSGPRNKNHLSLKRMLTVL